MTRQFISEPRLLAKINAKFASVPACRDYMVSALMRVNPDESGCNWSVAAMSGPYCSAGRGRSQAKRIIETFKARYEFSGVA